MFRYENLLVMYLRDDQETVVVNSCSLSTVNEYN